MNELELTIEQEIKCVSAKIYADLKEAASDLHERYWELHTRIGTEKFNHRSDQVSALAKLGELAIALEALDKARGKLHAVRCI